MPCLTLLCTCTSCVVRNLSPFTEVLQWCDCLTGTHCVLLYRGDFKIHVCTAQKGLTCTEYVGEGGGSVLVHDKWRSHIENHLLYVVPKGIMMVVFYRQNEDLMYINTHAVQPGQGTGATGLLDGEDKADGRWLHHWPHLWDACILTAWCMPSCTLALKTTKACGQNVGESCFL